ncbi:hypothetical protein LCGC14_2794860, partial [marine sediment metagenome]
HEYIQAKAKNEISKPATLNFLELKNGSKILCRPVGDTGDGMRGYSATMLILDEAAFIPNRAWEAIEPVISVTKGRTILLSTPQGKRGFFYKASINPNYNKEQVSARDCPRHTKKYLDQKQAELSPIAFATEYLGEFLDDYNRKFSDDWIKKVCHIDEKEQIIPKIGKNYGGFDLARMGGDSFTSEILKRINPKNIIQIDHFTRRLLLTTENENLIMEYTRKWDCTQSGIDAGAGTLGVSIYDHLMLVSDMKRRIIAMNNRSISINQEDGKQRLFNEDMHDNLRAMGERGELHLYNNDEVKASFRSVRWDLVKDAHGLHKVRITGRDTHVVEGIKRAAELALHDTSLSLWAAG